MNQLGDQEAQILTYSQAVKKLEAPTCYFSKTELSLNEKLTFQANEIYEKDEKLKRYRRIGMKAGRTRGKSTLSTKKKVLFVVSLSHLIKDCDIMKGKSAEKLRLEGCNTVQLNAGRPKFNSVRPNINTGRININYGRPKVNAVSSNINTVRSRQPVPNKTSNSSSPKRPQMNQMNQRRDFSKSYSSVRRPFAKTTTQMSHSNAVIRSWGSAVKTSESRPQPLKPGGHRTRSQGFNWRILKNSMGNGICYFGLGSKATISGKDRIRVGNLDFDSVSIVKDN
ncbi:hypothetical protein Tco_1405585 [Tanacetum coccineum]